MHQKMEVAKQGEAHKSINSPALSSICVMKTVDSTNSYLARTLSTMPGKDSRVLVQALAKQPGWQTSKPQTSDEQHLQIALALADRQTHCRGRLGRVWYNKTGQSLLGSWAVALPNELLFGRKAGWLPMAVCMAVIQGLEKSLHDCDAHSISGQQFNQLLQIKWPNDIFCSGHKLAGILCEALPVGEAWSVLIAGVGLNLFIPAESLPTPESTSLHHHYAPLPAYSSLRNLLVENVSTSIQNQISQLAFKGDQACDELREHILTRSWTVGKKVIVQPVTGESVSGYAMDIQNDASLLVETDKGKQISVTTADVGVLPNLAANT